jgi:hypothetical protein
MQEEMAKKA